MMKEKYFSVYSDFKTSILSKVFFLFSGILIFVVIILKVFYFLFPDSTDGFDGYLVSLANSSFIDVCLALIILSAGLGAITLFFHRQFKKLSAIADEIEKVEKNNNKSM